MLGHGLRSWDGTVVDFAKRVKLIFDTTAT